MDFWTLGRIFFSFLFISLFGVLLAVGFLGLIIISVNSIRSLKRDKEELKKKEESKKIRNKFFKEEIEFLSKLGIKTKELAKNVLDGK